MNLYLQKDPTTAPGRIACGACSLGRFCFAGAPGQGESPVDIRPLLHRRRLKAGQVLFEKGGLQSSLYAIRAGSLKTCARLPNGRRQVVGFHLVGDALGLDALASGTHRTDAIALNACEVCEIPLAQAERLMQDGAGVATHLRALLSEEIATTGEHVVLLSALSARQRVAGFLLELSARWRARGHSADDIDLCMTRKEIGSYLGLTFETVSRTLSYFDSKQWIGVEGRRVRIVDRRALRAQHGQA